jgi:ParB/RepB/Spo0J family partition protein
MAKKKPGGLGRGLDSIFLDNTESSEKRELLLKVSKIEPEKNQPRKRFDEEALAALADSIREHGVIQPIAVRESDNGYYKIIAGERRWRASKLAGLTEIPAIIITADDRKAAELSMIENLQREDLDPIEEAQAFRRLIEEFDLKQDEVAERVSRSRTWPGASGCSTRSGGTRPRSLPTSPRRWARGRWPPTPCGSRSRSSTPGFPAKRALAFSSARYLPPSTSI